MSDMPLRPVSPVDNDRQQSEASLDALCQRYKAVILHRDHQMIHVACHEAEPDTETLSNVLRFASGLKVQLERWPQARLEQVMQPESAAAGKAATEEENRPSSARDEHNELNDESDAPVINVLNQILRQAITRRASDIHFEPYEHSFRVRVRIDGVLQEIPGPEFSLAAGVCARLKIMGQLNVAERRLPQDGQLSVMLQNKRYSMRISSLPTLHGEKIVLRILHMTQQDLSMPQLGFTPRDLDYFKAALKNPQGLILVTGPTGSGKTVTLYSGLRHLNAMTHNICSVEDPVEIPVSGINQTQINSKTDLSFASVLRALLRQDPDVIMVGEIRDKETAEIAVKAAQTGHLVLSTLHTNSTCETLTRLRQMGIEGFHIAASLRLVIAQRLVRKLCPHCRKPHISLVEKGPDGRSGPVQLWLPAGCHQCFSGYYGRTGIYEVLNITPRLQQALVAEASVDELSKIAREQGQKTLQEAGMLLVEQGITSLEELYRVTGEGSGA
ncbi:protein transport protein HofB [Rahnella sp. BIGb0236]|uniref:type II secretion system protein GspE n=1 Tax=Rahnella TaxID=34037 RepID=UPI000BB1EF09|nr:MULTISPECIES: type II secretion system protein GspE [Rahnella]PBI81837.1 type II secretion system protein GspE [Rahnella victoriana]TDS92571.1 protein transport protein HofB [Rahnella sp. BIGb0236]